MCCPLRLPQGPGLPLLLPGNGLLTQQSATTALGGCQHQQMLYLQHAQDDPSPPPLPSHWQGEETGDSSSTLGLVNAWDQAMWRFFYFAFLEDSRCVSSFSLSVFVYFVFLFLFLISERGVFSGHSCNIQQNFVNWHCLQVC